MRKDLNYRYAQSLRRTYRSESVRRYLKALRELARDMALATGDRALEHELEALEGRVAKARELLEAR